MPSVEVISKALHFKAVKFNGNNMDELKEEFSKSNFVDIPNEYHKPYLYTLHGRLFILPGDWVVQGYDGDMKIYRDDVFRYHFSPYRFKPIVPSQTRGEEVNESDGA